MAPGDVQSAFAQAAAEDGIVLGSQGFDWLCEQGHVGLERVAKARRDPALVGPVKAALGPLAAIYARLKGDVSVLHASRENLLLAVDLVHAPTGTVIEVDEAAHFTSFRLTALELYPADARVGFDLGEHAELCRAWCARTDRPRPRAGGQGLRLRRAPARARLPRRAARPRRAGHGPPAGGPDRGGGRRRGGGLRAPPRGAAGPQRLPEAGVVLVGGRDVDRRAAPALDADLVGHLHLVHRLGEHVAALARRRSRRARCRGTRAGRRPPGRRSRRRAAPRPSRTSRITTRAIGVRSRPAWW